MSIPAQCPACGYRTRVPEEQSGTVIACLLCGKSFTVPRAARGEGSRAAPEGADAGRKASPSTASARFPELLDEDVSTPSRTPAAGPRPSWLPLLAQLVAVLGTGLLIVGLFVPLAGDGAGRPLTLLQEFRTDRPDGILLVILTFGAALLAVSRIFVGLWLAGLGVIAVLAGSFTYVLLHLAPAAAGPGGAAASPEHLQWGWAVLAAGGALVLGAAIAAVAQQRPEQRFLILLAGPASVPAMILLSGGLTWAVTASSEWAQERKMVEDAGRRRAADLGDVAATRLANERTNREATPPAKPPEPPRTPPPPDQPEPKTANPEPEPTPQTTAPLEGAPKTADAAPNPHADWADASRFAVRQGEVRVQVQGLRVRNDHLLVQLRVGRDGPGPAVRFTGWNQSATRGGPVLRNNFGQQFKWVPGGAAAEGPLRGPVELRPGQTATDWVAFEKPADVAVTLRLELPAAAFGGAGRLRFEVPRATVICQTAPSLGTKAVPGLLDLMGSPDQAVRREAATGLGTLGPEAGAAAADLGKAVKTGDLDVRLAALKALGKIGPAARPALPDILRAWTDPDEAVRRTVPETLAQVGAPTKGDVPALGDALKSDSAEVRRYAASALELIGPDAGGAIHELVKALADTDRAVRLSAAGALGKLAGEAKFSVPALAKALEDRDPELRRQAAQALARLGPKAGGTRALIRALKDEDEAVARTAAEAVSREGGLGKDDVPVLAEVVTTGKGPARELALEALEKLGPGAQASAPALLGLMKDTDPAVRRRGVEVLGRVQAQTLPVIQALTGALRDPDEAVRKSAAASLGRIGPGAKVAVPDLLRALQDAVVHDEAADALTRVGKAAVSYLLVELEGKTDTKTRLEVIALLGRLGPDAREAAPALSTIAAQDRYPSVRQEAKAALQKIQAKK